MTKWTPSLKFWICAITVCLTACVSTPQSPEAAVRIRAQEWLDALMEFDIDGIYSYTSPAYQSAHSASFYSKNYAGRNMWRTATIGDVRCDGEPEFGVCKVDLVVTYRGFTMSEEMTTVLTETWVELDGRWYTKPRQ